MRKFLVVLLVVLLSASCAFAFGVKHHIQPTGEKVEYILKGNVFLLWMEDLDGNLLAIGKDGYFEYGVWDLKTGGVNRTGLLAAIDPATPESKVHPIPQVVFDAAQKRRIDFDKTYGPQEDEAVSEPSFLPFSKTSGSGAPTPLPGIGDGSDIEGRIFDTLIVYVTFDGPSLHKPGITDLHESYFYNLMYSPTRYWKYDDPGIASVDSFRGQTFHGSVAHYFYDDTYNYATKKAVTSIRPASDSLGRAIGVVQVKMDADWNRSYDIYGNSRQFGVVIEERNNGRNDPENPHWVNQWSLFRAAMAKQLANQFDFTPYATYNTAAGRYEVVSTTLAIGFVFSGYSWETSVEQCVLQGLPGFWANSGSSAIDIASADIAGRPEYNGRALRLANGMFCQTALLLDRDKDYAVRPRQFAVFAHELGHNCYRFSDTYDVQGYYRVNSNTQNYYKRSGDVAYDIDQPYEATLMNAAFGNWGIQGTGGYIFDPMDKTASSPDIGAYPSGQDAWNWVERPQFTPITPRVISKDGSYRLDTGEIIKIEQTPGQYFYLQVRNNSGYNGGAFGWARKTLVALSNDATFVGSRDFHNAKGGLLIIHVDNDRGTAPSNRELGSMYALPAVVKEAHGGVQHLQFRCISDRAMSEYTSNDVNFNMADPADLFGNSVKQFPAPLASDPTKLDPAHARLFTGPAFALTELITSGPGSGDRKVIEADAIKAHLRQSVPSGDPITFRLENINYYADSVAPGVGHVTFDFKNVKESVSIDFKAGSKTITIVVGESKPLSPELVIFPAEYNATSGDAIIWSRLPQNTTVLSISASGVVTGLAQGQATVRATLSNDRTVSADCTVNVNIVPVTSVTLNQNTLTLTGVGQTATLTATVLPDNATDKSVTWTSSATAVATVSNTGTVTAVNRGNATITVKTNQGGLEASCAVQVNSVVPPSGETITLPGGVIVELPGGTVITPDGTMTLPAADTGTATTSEDVTIKIPGGTIITPDGTIKIPAGKTGLVTTPDSMEIVIPEGTEIKPDGTAIIPAGKIGKIILEGGEIDIPEGAEIKSDGTVIIKIGTIAQALTSNDTEIVLPGNTVIDPDGTINVGDEDAAGAKVKYSNGKTENVRSGATITINPNGTLKITGNGGGGGGCNVGILVLALIAAVPFVRKRQGVGVRD